MALVAERVGVSIDTIERGWDEAPVTHVDDAAVRRARGIGRPSKASGFADEVRSWPEAEPERRRRRSCCVGRSSEARGASMGSRL